MNVDTAIALLVVDGARSGGVAEAAIRRHPIVVALVFAVAHLVEPEILGVLQEGGERFFEERQGGVGGPVAILDPPGAPGGSFHKPIPARMIEHAEALEFGIGREHPPRNVEQLQIFLIPFAAEELSLEHLGLQGRQSPGREAEEQDADHDRAEDRLKGPGHRVSFSGNLVDERKRAR